VNFLAFPHNRDRAHERAGHHQSAPWLNYAISISHRALPRLSRLIAAIFKEQRYEMNRQNVHLIVRSSVIRFFLAGKVASTATPARGVRGSATMSSREFQDE